MPIRDVETPSGTFHVHVAGKSGVPLVLLHGGTASGREWQTTLDALGGECHVYAPDRLGCGESGRSFTGYGMPEQGQSIIDLADALQLDRPVLVGQSLGGMVAMHAALRDPGRWRALVLVDSAGAPSTGEDRAARRAGMAAETEEMSARDRAERIARSCFFRPERIPVGHVELIMWQTEQADPAIATAMRSPTGFAAPIAYEKITLPTLVVWGADDVLTPLAGGERLAARLPNARLHVIPDCGHLPQYEQPGAFHTELRRFLREQA